MFVIASVGCCGAVNESNCLLMTFSGLLFLILLLEAGGFIAAYAYQNDIGELVKKSMLETMNNYSNDTSTTDAEDKNHSWDAIQQDLGCCGVDGEYYNRLIVIMNY
jgi:hypothetical protein